MRSEGGAAILLMLAALGCQSADAVKPPSTESPKPSAGGPAAAKPSEPQTETVTLKIADSVGPLGTFVLAPGQPGVLTLDPQQAGRAAQLQKVCDRINASETVSVDVESRPTPGHFVAESRAARRGTKDYPNIVHTKLVSEGFKVAR